ncbi:MAG TPA: peptidoglycan binding domain-containing protein [Roseiflexaceae bacterium]|nr:peptidoglycan binding domain-containing protein [Roseiflexaceae bacterium]
MADKYYQEYGPISRRRADGTLSEEDQPASAAPLPEIAPVPLDRPMRRRFERRKRRRGGLLGLLVVVLIGAGGFMALPYAANILAGDRAMDGVSLQGRSIAGMDRAEIRALIEQRYAGFLRAPVTLTFEGRSWAPTPEQLGLGFDLDQAAEQALAAGHRGGPIERVRELWALWQGGLDVAPRLSVDAGRLQAYLTTLAAEVDHPPRDAALSFAEGRVLPTAARPGRQVLADATAIDVMLALQTLEPRQVVLRTRTLTPTLTDVGMAQAIDDARALLSAPLVLRRAEQSWNWPPNKLAELLTLKTEQGRMSVDVDAERLARAVEKLAQLVDSGSAEPRVAFRGGKPRIVEPGQTGWQLKQPEAAAAIVAALRQSKRDIALPVQELTPQVTAKTLPSLGLTELVGEGRSSFAGSAEYRITNIKAGAARMNGVLIPPGSEFSFNTQLGEVDDRNGFVKGYAVIGQRTQLEWGGGVCQDSTTVFRAAFWAGLPITERHAHPFYISWYDDFSFPGESGPGLDATIYTGVSDLKFLNDTGNWLLMEAIADESAQVLTVRLYGTKPNRSVSIRGPEIDNVVQAPDEPVIVTDNTLPAGTVKQTDTARRGMDITVYRVITENGVEKAPEPFFTRFKAWPNVFVKGTG